MASIFDELTATATAPAVAQAATAGGEVLTVVANATEDTAAITPRQIKEASQELLRLGVVDAAKKPLIYSVALRHAAEINRVLEPLDLMMKIDDVRGLAFLLTMPPLFATDDEEWTHPLVRRQRLTLEQSLLVALLRQHYVVHEQEAGVGADGALVALDDLLPQLQMYLGNMGSDAREQQRLRALLGNLKTHGIVSEVSAADQVTIFPVIVHLANPENLQGLLHAFTQAARPVSEAQDGERA